MKFLCLFIFAVFFGQEFAYAVPPDGGGNRWRRVTCYSRDSKNVDYSAHGFRHELNRVRERALRVCRYYSERPSTCRIMRCRP